MGLVTGIEKSEDLISRKIAGKTNGAIHALGQTWVTVEQAVLGLVGQYDLNRLFVGRRRRCDKQEHTSGVKREEQGGRCRDDFLKTVARISVREKEQV
jgi:hypothetical protein